MGGIGPISRLVTLGRLWLLTALLLLPSAACVVLRVGPTIPIESMPANTAQDVRSAIAKLYSPDCNIRSQAAVDLSEMGARAVSAVPFLVSMLDDYGSTSGRPCVSRIDPAYTRFMSSLTPADARGRAYLVSYGPTYKADGLPPNDYAADALRRIGAPAVPALVAALRGKRIGTLERFDLANAAWALGEIRDERSVQPLIALLTDPDLLSEKDPMGMPALRFSSRAHASAISALGKIGDRRAVAPLVMILSKRAGAARPPDRVILAVDGVPVTDDVVLAAIEALGLLRDPRARSALEDISRIPLFRNAAMRSLASLTQ